LHGRRPCRVCIRPLPPCAAGEAVQGLRRNGGQKRAISPPRAPFWPSTCFTCRTRSKKEDAEKTLYYILAYPSKEAADRSWKAFRDDPDWIKAKKESEKDGVLVAKVESVYMNPTDYSPMK
jgi:hypothetical protein